MQDGSCPTTVGPLGEATGVIHDDNSCSLSDTRVVLSAMLSVSPTEELKTGNCAARQSGFKSHFLLCVPGRAISPLWASAFLSVKWHNKGLHL